jgi:hypothetical protein
MARKRKPLVICCETVAFDAPGLHLVRRSNGTVQQYSEASAEARNRAYLPRTVRLHFDLEAMQGRKALEERCKTLTNEMLSWLGDPLRSRSSQSMTARSQRSSRAIRPIRNRRIGVSPRTPNVAVTIGAARLIARSASGALIG